MSPSTELDTRCITTIRMLAVDAVQAAGTGHCGTPLGAAAVGFALWNYHLRHNPQNPKWPNRDRFVLSCGHASLLQYSLLHLTGYDLPLDEIRNFRKYGSKTPGHPEYGYTPGVELTTGPLGQGFANAVGMALAERCLAATFNRPQHPLFDHHTYVLASDGDLQEGVASEAASLAATLNLGKLICLYDDNDTQIGGSTDETFKEDVGARFAAYGWQVIGPLDGNDPGAVSEAIRQARSDPDRPSLIVCKTIIGYGSPVAGTYKAHHGPLGVEGVKQAREFFHWPQEPLFYVPEDVLAHMRKAIQRGAEAVGAWQRMLDSYRAAYPEEASQLDLALSGDLVSGWATGIDGLFTDVSKKVAPRTASHTVLNLLAPRIPNLIGGSADLADSTKVVISDGGAFSAETPAGRNIRYGVREHAMGSISLGMALHGGILPFTSTYFTFADYMRPPMRLAAMMRQRVIFIFTHDSIGVGEDGPTHQAVEQLMNLRGIPHLLVLRPADASEVAECWKIAAAYTGGPVVLILARQDVPVLDRKVIAPAEGVRRGGYILWQSADRKPDVILLATGSEVHVALDAGLQLAEKGIPVRVVSMPSFELFDKQSAAYRESVLPANVRARISIEAGSTLGWHKYVGLDGVALGVDDFGESGPANALYEKFGLTAARVVEEAECLLTDR